MRNSLAEPPPDGRKQGMIRRELLALLALPAFPTTNPAAALEMVTVAHRDPARVRALVAYNAGLVQATIDWGFGDWETALGAASHVGNREIAEYLLAHGATPTVFSAAMLGQVDLVKAMIAGRPGLERTRGPHGLTLMAHARAGGTLAAPVVQYLQELGNADVPLPTQPLAQADLDRLPGRYAFGPGADDHYVVDVQKSLLGILRPGAPARRLLLHAGSLVFFPTGAPSVRIAFAQEGERVTGFTMTGLGAAMNAQRTVA